MACIYCGQPADSREHWLPRALGAIRGLEPLAGRICKTCNQALGRELDEDFVRTGPTGFFRTLHGIEGRRHHAPVNLFHFRATSPLPPTTLLRRAPDGEHQILAEAYIDQDGRRVAKPLRQLVLKTNDAALVPVPFPPAYDGPQLKRMLAARGLEHAELVEVYLEEDELADGLGSEQALALHRLLTEVFGKSNARLWYGRGELARGSVDLFAGIRPPYVRALAKTGFHYFLAFTPNCTGAEPEFAELRAFIRHGNGDAGAFVDLAIPHFIPDVAAGRVPARTSHFFLAHADAEGVRVRMLFFVGPDHLPPACAVRLGSHPRSVLVPFVCCHQVSYHDEGTVDGFDGILDTIPVTLVPNSTRAS